MISTPTFLYKAIISDFDGTLCGSDFVIPPSVVASVNQWVASGRHFSIATGKSFFGTLKKSIAPLQLRDPIIAGSGSYTIDPVTEEIINAQYIPEHLLTELLHVITKSDQLFELESVYSAYTAQEQLKLQQSHKKYLPLDSAPFTEIVKLRLIAREGSAERLHIFMTEQVIGKYTDVHIVAANTPYSIGYDITAPGATKYEAVKKLIAKWQLQSAQIIGVGDGLTDLGILEQCGLKVAMEGSPKELVAAADLVQNNDRYLGMSSVIASNG